MHDWQKGFSACLFAPAFSPFAPGSYRDVVSL
jgi:hypothetical protein